MAVKTLYFKNSLADGGAVTALSLQDGGTAPATGITTTGWTVAKLAAPNLSAMQVTSEKASGTFGSTDQIGSFNSAMCFRSENAYTGQFANTNWSFVFRLRAVTSASSQTGQVRIRVWKSASAQGTSPTQLTSAVVNGTTTAALSTSASQSSTVTWTPGGVVTLTNEYLWVQCEWSIGATSGNNNADVLFYIESAGAITTPDFTLTTNYTETITASALPIVGGSITPVYYTHTIVETITAGSIPIGGQVVFGSWSGAPTETEVFSTTFTTNTTGDGGYSYRCVIPVTGMSDAAFLVAIMDHGTTSNARYIGGLGAITGTPGVGALTALAGVFDSYRLASELANPISGLIYNVNSVKIRGSGTSREICARFEASTVAATNFDNISIGIWNGTNSPASPYQGSTTFTPVELKWGGVSGKNISAGTDSGYSDWMPFPDNVKGAYGPHAMSSLSAGWNLYTTVCTLVPANLRAVSGGTQARFTFLFGPGTAASAVTVAYVGQQDPAGDAFDFRPSPAPAPVHITWGGSDLVNDGVNQIYPSDWITLPEPWDETKTYCVSCQFTGTTEFRHSSSITTGGNLYYKNAAEAATLDKTSYSPLHTNNPVLIELVEVKLPSGGISYSESITAGALPIVGQSISDSYVPGSANIVETITAGSIPIVGGTITPAYVGRIQFDPATTSSTIALSNNNLTATRTDAAGTYVFALSTPTRGATKVYCEAHIDNSPSGAPYVNIGVAIPTFDINNNLYYVGQDATAVGLYGNVAYYNGADTGIYMVPAADTGKWIGVAVDRTAGTIQFRNITDAGSWSGTAAISGITSGEICFITSPNDQFGAATANFDGAFLGTAPASGYTKWDGSPLTAGPVDYVETIAAGSIPIVGGTVTPVISRGYSDTITASSLPIVGGTITPARGYGETITASALPIIGQAVTPNFSAGPTNYTEVIAPSAVPIGGAIILPSAKLSAVIAASALPLVGQNIVPNFSHTITTRTSVKVGGVWKPATTYVKHDGTWKVATPYVKHNGVWTQT